MNNDNIEISKVVSHLDEIERAEPSFQFLKNLDHAIDIEYRDTKIVNLKWISGIAASLLLIVSINTYVLLGSQDTSYVSANDELSQDYTLIPTQNFYYE